MGLSTSRSRIEHFYLLSEILVNIEFPKSYIKRQKIHLICLEQWQIQDFLKGGDKSQTAIDYQKLYENERNWTPRVDMFLAFPLGSISVSLLLKVTT